MRNRIAWCCGAISVIALSGMTWGQQVRFEERAGQYELSGRLTARPIQYDDWRAMGFSDADAMQRVDQARDRLDQWRIDTIDQIDVHVLLVPDSMTEAQLATQLLATGDYQYVEPDWIVYPASTGPDDPDFDEQWQLPRIHAPEAWDMCTGDPSVICAFVDTGIDTDHPDLADALVPGYNAPDHLPQDQGGEVEDIVGHGTSVAGSAAAISNNGIGVAAVGWDLSIMPIRATNKTNGSATSTDIITGALWAADHGAKVINVSYTGVMSSNAQVAGEYVKNAGGLLVWAADNAGIDYSWFDWPDVIIVAGTKEDDTLMGQSSHGLAIDVAAPGKNVYLTKWFADYGFASGTSYAAPLVTGALAVLWSFDPDLTPDEAEAILFDSCTDIGEPGEDNLFGHGLIDLHRALVDAAGPYRGANAGTIPMGESPADDPTTIFSGQHPARTGPGLFTGYYDVGVVSELPDFVMMEPYATELTGSVDFPFSTDDFAGSRLDRGVGAVFEGFFQAPATASYTFWTESSDGSALWIDGQPVVDNDGIHAMEEVGGTIALRAGLHQFHIDFFSAEPGSGLIARVEGGPLGKQVIPDTLLFFEPIPVDFNADGMVNSLDLISFINAFAIGDMSADFNGDGVLTTLDMLDFLNAYNDATR